MAQCDVRKLVTDDVRELGVGLRNPQHGAVEHNPPAIGECIYVGLGLQENRISATKNRHDVQ